MDFGQRMQRRREELGRSRAELAAALGVTPSAFFDEGESLPQLRESFIGKARALGEDDMKMLIPLMDRMAGEGAA